MVAVNQNRFAVEYLTIHDDVGNGVDLRQAGVRHLWTMQRAAR